MNPLTWVAIGVFAMLAGLSWIGGQPLVAGVALILSFAAMFAAIWQRFSFGSAGGMTVSLSKLGAGPHRT